MKQTRQECRVYRYRKEVLLWKTENTPPRPRRRRRRKRKPLWPLVMVNVLLLTIAAVQLVRLDAAREQPLVTQADASTWPADRIAPVIHGVTDITIELGQAVSYLDGVTVTDDRDQSPQLQVDPSGVDLSREGAYTVSYEAWDDAGNRAHAFAVVTVKAPETQKYSTDDVEAVIAPILGEIIADHMTLQEQVRTIYDWCRENLRYGGHTTRGHYTQGAMEMLETGKGDCYGYYCVSKAMFEYLDIPNIDVQKEKRSAEDSEHYWSLVSLDGEETWYHFDATPRVGQTEDLCLVTDTFLDSFDTFHDNCHNRDKSKYPATPEGW